MHNSTSLIAQKNDEFITQSEHSLLCSCQCSYFYAFLPQNTFRLRCFFVFFTFYCIFFAKIHFFQAKKQSGSTAIFGLSKKINIFQDCKDNPTFYKHYLTIQGVMRALYAFGKGSEEKTHQKKSVFWSFLLFLEKCRFCVEKANEIFGYSRKGHKYVIYFMYLCISQKKGERKWLCFRSRT